MPKRALKYISNMDFRKKDHQCVFLGFKQCTIVAFAILRKAYFFAKFGSRVKDESVFALSISLQDFFILGGGFILY